MACHGAIGLSVGKRPGVETERTALFMSPMIRKG